MSKNQRKNTVINATFGLPIGGEVVVLKKVVRRLMPGLWSVDGVDCVGVNDLLDAFSCR